jgi:FMN-dependent NADH-azoreductase
MREITEMYDGVLRMSTLLHIDASARFERSISRGQSAKFMDTWLGARPGDTVIRRDLAVNPPGFVTEDWIGACFTPEEDRTAAQGATLEESDELISELEAADLVVLGTPMYNYGMPAVLKAWVDRIVRVGKTFSFDLARGDYPLEPILRGKILVGLTSKGEFGFAPGAMRDHMNFLDGHIEAVAHYLGLEERYFVHVEYQEFGGDRHVRSCKDGETNAVALAETLARAFTDREKAA